MNKGRILGKAVGAVREETEKTVSTGVSQVSGKEARVGQFATDKEREDFLKGLYGDLDKPQPAEDAKKLIDLRKKLHNETYYEPLINPKRSQEEERPAEKVEREEKQEMAELQEKEKEKPPPLVLRNRQRVERIPGAG